MKTLKIFITIILITTIILSCSKAARIIPIENLTLNETQLNFFVDQEIKLEVEITPKNATNKTIIWQSSDEEVALVSQDGLVTAINDGKVIITVSTEDNLISDTCNVIVTKAHIPVTGISLNITLLTLEVSETETLIVTIEPENATDKTIVWTSSDENVASVSEEGLVVALSEGNVTISATSLDGHFTTECSIEIIDPITFSVSNREQWLNAIDFIKNNGDNKTYIINLINDITTYAGSNVPTFGDVENISVTINGNHIIKMLGSHCLVIGSYQEVTINDCVFEGSVLNMPEEIIRVEGTNAVFNMRGNATLRDNPESAVFVIDGIFNMYSGSIINNIAELGAGVKVGR